MRDYKKLNIWEKSYKLGLSIYTVTQSFPKEEVYGLTSQLRRCAISVPSNIAEGSRRSTEKDFKSFLHIAYGSLAEIEVQIMYATDLEYISKKDSETLLQEISEISKMVNAFIAKLS